MLFSLRYRSGISVATKVALAAEGILCVHSIISTAKGAPRAPAVSGCAPFGDRLEPSQSSIAHDARTRSSRTNAARLHPESGRFARDPSGRSRRNSGTQKVIEQALAGCRVVED